MFVCLCVLGVCGSLFSSLLYSLVLFHSLCMGGVWTQNTEMAEVQRELNYFRKVLSELAPATTTNNSSSDTTAATAADGGTDATTTSGGGGGGSDSGGAAAAALSAAAGGSTGSSGASASASGAAPSEATAAGAAAEMGRECIICSDDDMKIVSMAPCGHYFCGSPPAPITLTLPSYTHHPYPFF